MNKGYIINQALKTQVMFPKKVNIHIAGVMNMKYNMNRAMGFLL